MVYHGQPRILTEIASVDLADPIVNPAGRDVPLGPQDARWNFPLPYKSGDWRLRDIVDYGVTAAFAGISSRREEPRHLARELLQGPRRLGEPEGRAVRLRPSGRLSAIRTKPTSCSTSCASAKSRSTRRKAPFSAGGRQYAAGSWVIKLAQPYGAFAKTMLERQQYPDLRLFPGGPPKPPYDVTGHTLGLLMGVEVDQIDQPFEANLEIVRTLRPALTAMPAATRGGPISSDRSRTRRSSRVARLQAAGIATYRAARAFEQWWSDVCAGNVDRAPFAGSDAHPGGRVHRGGSGGRGGRQARAGRRVPAQAGDAHRPLARRQQHAGRLDEVAVRAVRLQPPRDRLD